LASEILGTKYFMALQTDPSGVPRLIGDNTSESVNLSVDNSRFGGVTTNFPSGVWMLGGDDSVIGSTANDVVYGNEGEEIILGDFGNDSLFGGKGKDLLSGDEGNDYLSGGQDADVFLGSGGNDILLGGRGNDLLFSGNGFDTLVGGVGRDLLGGFNDTNTSIKISGSNLYVLQPEAGVNDVNQADLIRGFRVGFDRIGLAEGLTANDIVLENLTNVSIVIQAEVSQFLSSIATPDLLRPTSFLTSGTLIKVRNSGNVVGFVADVTPSQIQGSITSVQGF
jgi:Ca2+-binding RTX toxin-like protein